MGNRGIWIMIITLLVVVSVGWVGLSIYDARYGVPLNAGAAQKATSMPSQFDTATLDTVDALIQQLPISLDDYHVLKNKVDASGQVPVTTETTPTQP